MHYLVQRYLPTSSQFLFRSQTHSRPEHKLQESLFDIQLPVHRTRREASFAASEGKHDVLFKCSLSCSSRCLNALHVTNQQLSSRSLSEGSIFGSTNFDQQLNRCMMLNDRGSCNLRI